jgi:hypothetical protein
VGNECERLFF